MANRRMFAKSVVEAGRFSTLTVPAQCLYFHLGMQADDDGFVEALMIIRSAGLKMRDYTELCENGYIIQINDSMLSWIVDWNENNQLLKDRYHPSTYHGLLPQLRAALETKCKQDGNTLISQDGDGNKMLTQVRLGKISLDYSTCSARAHAREAVEPGEVEPESVHAGANADAESAEEREFASPSLEEVRDYARINRLQIDADAYYTKRSNSNWVNKRGRPITDWRQDMRTWARYQTKQPEPVSEPVTSFDTDEFFAAALARSYGEPVPLPKRRNG